MERVKIGTRVADLGIQKVNVADGTKARVVLIDADPQMKYIAYDNVVKRRVEVNQDLLIKYNLKPTATFFYLIARLNTDMKGNVVDDDFSIEYLQLTNNVNVEFADAVAENPNFTSVVLSKVSKKGDGGKDFSYTKATPSNYVVSEGIQNKIEVLRKNPEAIDALWKMIDRATSITADEYEKLVNSPLVTGDNGGVADLPQSQISAPAIAPKAIEAPAYVAPEPAMKQAESNDFGTGSPDDFNW